MTDKEKVKAYDKALERMKSWAKGEHPECFSEAQKTAEFIFPELTESVEESENEKIRKEIIHWLKNSEGQTLPTDRYNAALAWLEKQGEKEDDIVEVSPNEDGLIADTILFKKQNQGTQKPADKIGDWIFNNENSLYSRHLPIKIIKRGLLDCEVVDTFGYHHTITVDCINRNYHLWSINDAKDGDVLYDGDNALIFRKIMEDEEAFWVDSYCGIDAYGKFIQNSVDECWWLACDCIPATKEQRDELMKTMADAGYEFDFEKKELKNIVTPIFNVNDCIIKKHNSGINFGYFIITEITGGKYWHNGRIICDINEQDEWELYEPTRQKPVEWSEEDEEAVDMAIIALEDMYDQDEPLNTYGGHKLPFDKAAERLKSLRPQKQWKPSDEQMKALWDSISDEDVKEISEREMLLNSLYKDLKKLKN